MRFLHVMLESYGRSYSEWILLNWVVLSLISKSGFENYRKSRISRNVWSSKLFLKVAKS